MALLLLFLILDCKNKNIFELTNSVLSFCERNFTVFAFLETVQLFSLTLRLFLNFHEDKIFSFFGFWLALFVISCNRDEIEFDAPSKNSDFR